jgi:uncharacterized protein
MLQIHIALLIAGLCALMQVFMTALVIIRRAQTGIDFLHGDDGKLLGRIRAHGNFTETVPIAVIMLALLEMRGLGSAWVWSLGIALLIGRSLHALSLMTNNAAWSRRGGMSTTLLVLSVEAVACIFLFLR